MGLGQQRKLGRQMESSNMGKDKRNRETAADTAGLPDQVASDPGVVEAPAAGPNFSMTYRRQHPANRSSYGVSGNSGIIVFDNGLFPGSTEAGWTPPAVITLDCELVPVKADNKTAKAEAAAAKAQEKAAKAQAKIEAAQAKAVEKQRKADEAMAAAKAKLEAAQAAAAAKAAGAADAEAAKG